MNETEKLPPGMGFVSGRERGLQNEGENRPQMIIHSFMECHTAGPGMGNRGAAA